MEETTYRKLRISLVSLGVRKSQRRGSRGGGKGSDRHKLEADRCQFMQGLTGGACVRVCPPKAIDNEEGQAGEATMLEGA